MRPPSPPRAVLALVLLWAGGCAVDRGGLAPPDGEIVPRDAGVDAGVVCPPNTVDADGDPRNGCECVLSSPPTEVCNGGDDG